MTNQKQQFINEEIKRFKNESKVPFRVAVSDNGEGSYAYGSHAEERMYADMTIGYTNDLREAAELLAEAWDMKESIIDEAYN